MTQNDRYPFREIEGAIQLAMKKKDKKKKGFQVLREGRIKEGSKKRGFLPVR